MSRRRPSRFHGLLPVNKQPGPTSHDVVDMARKALGERRIGHTGTLDPMAEGLLLLCVGQATRLQQYLLGWDKTYRGQVRLGNATTTYDGEGEIIEPRGTPPKLDAETIGRLVERFTGRIEQVPPPYSAKKVAGKKLYELARSGQQVAIEPKSVTVYSLDLQPEGADLLSLEIKTSSGFYVRSLAHDIGVALGCGAYLHHLQRVAIGPYAIDDALAQEQLEEGTAAEEIVAGPPWIPAAQISLPFPDLKLNPTACKRFIHGQEVVVFRPGAVDYETGSNVVVRSSDDRLLGIGKVQAVLARGRTLNVTPAMVLEAAPSAAKGAPR